LIVPLDRSVAILVGEGFAVHPLGTATIDMVLQTEAVIQKTYSVVTAPDSELQKFPEMHVSRYFPSRRLMQSVLTSARRCSHGAASRSLSH
jgi:hypothetical protein